MIKTEYVETSRLMELLEEQTNMDISKLEYNIKQLKPDVNEKMLKAYLQYKGVSYMKRNIEVYIYSLEYYNQYINLLKEKLLNFICVSKEIAKYPNKIQEIEYFNNIKEQTNAINDKNQIYNVVVTNLVNAALSDIRELKNKVDSANDLGKYPVFPITKYDLDLARENNIKIYPYEEMNLIGKLPSFKSTCKVLVNKI